VSTAKWFGIATSLGVLGVIGASGQWLTHESREPSSAIHRGGADSARPYAASLASPAQDDLPEAPTIETPKVSSASPGSVDNPPASATPDRPTRTSLPVEHLHRLGHCLGQLRISPHGLEFIPDPPAQIDAFSLTYSEFLASLDGKSTLTIKSQRRTYRFKTISAKEEAPGQLSDFMVSIEQFRTSPGIDARLGTSSSKSAR
jgi:hypothetical protein